MRTEIAVIAGPREWGDSKASWLAKVPEIVRKALGTEKQTVSHRMVKALWYGEYGVDPDHHAARDIRRAAELVKARSEARRLADFFDQIGGGRNASNTNFTSADIHRLELCVRALRGLDRAG